MKDTSGTCPECRRILGTHSDKCPAVMGNAKAMPEGYSWCPDCGASQPKGHRCKDPVDLMSRDELLALVRVMRLHEKESLPEQRVRQGREDLARFNRNHSTRNSGAKR